MELQHFSHEHPLILGEVNDDGEAIVCNMCWEKISGSAFSCKNCLFFLHKFCVEFPEEMKHPIHAHSLTLQQPKFSIRCDVCNKKICGFTYRCSPCDFDLDIRCSVRGQHFSSKHQLMILNEDEKNDVHETVSCDVCLQQITGSTAAYKCTNCSPSIYFHKLCAQLPVEMEHPMHPDHPLSLLQVVANKFTCDGCDIDLKEFIYRCSICNFNLDICCALRAQKLKKLEKEPEGADAAISSVPETTPPSITTTAEQGEPSARTLSEQAIVPSQDIWAELSILQQHLDEISPLPQRLHLFHAETQQTLTIFINLINTPVDEIILHKPDETLACLSAVLNLSPNPFNPIQLKQLAKIITKWPTLSQMVQTCSKDIQTEKDFLNEAHTISTSLKLSQQTSVAILEQHSTLELEETKLMAKLATVRQRKAHLQQQHDQLNQEARMMLSQIRHHPASIQTTKAKLDQAQAMLAGAQSEWGVLAILFPKS